MEVALDSLATKGSTFVGQPLAGEKVGLQAREERLWRTQFKPLRLRVLREFSRPIVPTAGGVNHVPGHGEA